MTTYEFSLTKIGSETRLRASSELPVSAALAFAWHERPGAFERLSPPWETVRVVERSGGIQNGGRAVIETKLGPFTQRWVAEHCDYIAGRQFRDIQVEGPFVKWEHTHTVEPLADGRDGCRLVDEIVFKAPLAPLSDFAVHGRLENMFRYRHAVTTADLARHRQWGVEAIGKKRVLVTGSPGLIGRPLCAMLEGGGHEVVRLVRHKSTAPGELSWQPDVPTVDARDLEGFDAIIHLAGENIGDGEWTPAGKAEMKRSRVASTRLLAETIARLESRPAAFICASGTGIYGDTGDVEHDETNAHGKGFLAELADAWEEAAEPAASAGTHVVQARIGAVLSPQGGMLAKVLPIFRAGFGGPLAGGAQYLAWISVDDVAYSLYRMVVDSTLSGPVNVIAPEQITQREFAKTLGKQLSRPAWLPVPRAVLTALYGELAEETVLTSSRVVPAKLMQLGHTFAHPNLAAALTHLLGQ
jgi:uncharacterized protein